MKIEGNHNCEHCNKNISWFYQVPQKLGSRLDVETIPKGRVNLYSIGKTIEKEGYKIPLDATVYCPVCDRLNSIIINEGDGLK